jgi:hypothetical protein
MGHMEKFIYGLILTRFLILKPVGILAIKLGISQKLPVEILHICETVYEMHVKPYL